MAITLTLVGIVDIDQGIKPFRGSTQPNQKNHITPIRDMNLRPPFAWFGGKTRLATRIIEHFPEHETYVEVFGGSCAVLLAKTPACVEVYNDIDSELFNFYHVVRDPTLLKRLMRAVNLTLCSRAEFELAQQSTDDPVEAARRFFVRQRQSFDAHGGHWSYSATNSVKGISASARRWQAGLGGLRPVHQRLQSVQMERADWREIFKRYDTPATLFYVDPPYILSTRVKGGYRHELTEYDHEELVQILLTLRGRSIVSGYQHPIYDRLKTAGWRTISYDVPAFCSDRRNRRLETLWISPAPKQIQIQTQSPSLIVKESVKSEVWKQKRADAAHRTHAIRVNQTEIGIRMAIAELKQQGATLTQAAIARQVGISEEHMSRRYRHFLGNCLTKE